MPAPVDDFAREFAPPAPSGLFAPLVEKRLGELRRTAAAFAGKCWVPPEVPGVPTVPGPKGYRVTPAGLLVPDESELDRMERLVERLEAVAERLEGVRT